MVVAVFPLLLPKLAVFFETAGIGVFSSKVDPFKLDIEENSDPIVQL